MQNVPFAAQQEQVNKFLQANRALGAQMDQMQGTTRIIYDTYNVNATSFDYFSEVAGKQGPGALINGMPPTNITDNRFEPGEGMVVKEIGLINMDNQAFTPANVNQGVFGLNLINFYVGNNRVIKDLPILAGGSVTPINNLNPTSANTLNGINVRTGVMRLFTNIVIPPQVQFYLNVRFLFTSGAGNGIAVNAFRVYLKGYGKLFNPRNNY